MVLLFGFIAGTNGRDNAEDRCNSQNSVSCQQQEQAILGKPQPRDVNILYIFLWDFVPG
jgi:hypothetical protein